MEFNNKIIESTTATSDKEVVVDKIKLTSPERVSTNSISGGITVNTSTSDANAFLVSHDVRELKKNYNKDSIKTSLVTIYGKNSRVAMSSKDVETLAIPVSELPARLEYTFIVMENDIPVEYKADYLIPSKDSTAILPLHGKKQSSISEATIPESIAILDEEIKNIKTNLQDFSFLYDKNQNKVIPLQQLVLNLSTQIENLTKEIEDVKKKVKDL